MARTKMSPASKTEKVKLLIKGPKSILKDKKSIIIETRLNRTWYNLIWKDLGVELSPNSGLFVCSRTYCVTDPKNDQGWRSELSDSVADFVNKFERQRKQITVRICDPEIRSNRWNSSSSLPAPRTPAKKRGGQQKTNETGTVTASSSSCNRQLRNMRPRRHLKSLNGNDANTSNLNVASTPASRTRGRKNASKALAKKPQQPALTTPLEERHLENRFNTPRIDNVCTAVKLEPHLVEFWDESEMDEGDNEEPDQQQQRSNEMMTDANDSSSDDDFSDSGQDGHDGDDDDLSSLCTAATVENYELRQEGIQVEDVKGFVQSRVPRFSNAYLIRVKNEIQKMKQNNVWDRNVKRSPLACYLLQELFK